MSDGSSVSENGISWSLAKFDSGKFTSSKNRCCSALFLNETNELRSRAVPLTVTSVTFRLFFCMRIVPTETRLFENVITSLMISLSCTTSGVLRSNSLITLASLILVSIFFNDSTSASVIELPRACIWYPYYLLTHH